MGGDYEKSVFHQLMEITEKLDVMKLEHKQNHKEIKRLTNEVSSLRNANDSLCEKVSVLNEECTTLKEKNIALDKENRILRNDNERMKRILGNDSSNSSLPPSKDQPGKSPNTYNSRKPTKKKKGAQPGHKGNGLSKADVVKKIQEGIYEHHIKNIGNLGRDYITRYRLDLKVKTTVTEIRIHADEKGKFQVPTDLKADVSYGENIKAIAAFLYSEGVVANDRICTFINSLSGDSLRLSTGSVYGFCSKFAGLCSCESAAIEQELLNSHEICTDATTVKTNGKQTYIRNFSTEKSVLYGSSEGKSLEDLSGFKVLQEFAGTLTHDHETGIYHFGIKHGECNVHLERYLLKNSEETGNIWSHNLSSFLNGMNHTRNEWKLKGYTSFTAGQLKRYSLRYDEIIASGLEANKETQGRIAKKEEKALLNRLKKYKENHLLFLYDFQIHFSNNISEKDLRICKNRQKMAGGFRTASGRQMYCEIMSFIETVKRRKLNIFQSIVALMNGIPVIN